MKNAYFGFFNPHRCANRLGKGYICVCGFKSLTKREHNKHVHENHTKEEAEELMSWKDFEKFFP